MGFNSGFKGLKDTHWHEMQIQCRVSCTENENSRLYPRH